VNPDPELIDQQTDNDLGGGVDEGSANEDSVDVQLTPRVKRMVMARGEGGGNQVDSLVIGPGKQDANMFVSFHSCAASQRNIIPIQVLSMFQIVVTTVSQNE
jgi:hypothetical protein